MYVYNMDMTKITKTPTNRRDFIRAAVRFSVFTPLVGLFACRDDPTIFSRAPSASPPTTRHPSLPDGGSDAVQNTTSKPADPTKPSLFGTVVFAAQPTETDAMKLYLLDLATRNIHRVTDGMGNDRQPVFSPDGKYILFDSNRSGREQVYIMHADMSDSPQQLTTDPNWNMQPSFSPDGGAIAYLSIGVDPGIYLMDLQSGTRGRFMHPIGTQYAGRPSFSPSGDRLVAVVDNQLFVFDVRTGQVVSQLTNDLRAKIYPAWNLEGDRIAYSTASADDSMVYDIALVNPSRDRNQVPERVVSNGSLNLAPAWAGDKIIFDTNVGMPPDDYFHRSIYIVGADGRGIDQIIGPTMMVQTPFFKPA